MNPDAFRLLYEYHFSGNQRLWHDCIACLSGKEFRRMLPYSRGSVRNQIVHMLNMEDRCFSTLRGEPVPRVTNPVHLVSHAAVRARWEAVEVSMRQYLAIHDLTRVGAIPGRDSQRVAGLIRCTEPRHRSPRKPSPCSPNSFYWLCPGLFPAPPG